VVNGVEYPDVDEFVPVDVQAEMTHEEGPDYPRLARQAEIQGAVWVTVLVGEDGKVIEKRLYKSSGTTALDDAALAVADKNRFNPALKDGHPVAVWVKYKVKFSLGY